MKNQPNAEIMARMIQLLRNDVANLTLTCAEYRANCEHAQKQIEQLLQRVEELETENEHPFEKPEHVATS